VLQISRGYSAGLKAHIPLPPQRGGLPYNRTPPHPSLRLADTGCVSRWDYLLKKLTWFAFLCLLWVGVLLSTASLLYGQMVTFTGPPANFGNINICEGAKTKPAPCSATMALNYKVTKGGTLGTPRALTLGAPGPDFILVSSTCKGSITAGATCVAQVKFAPAFPGLRAGAVEITDGSGNVVTTTLIHGVGIGPQISFDGIPSESLVGDQNANIFWGGVAVDGFGDLFFPNGERADEGVAPAVFELTQAFTLKTVGFGFSSPQQVAIDGAGTLYITDAGTNLVVELPAGCAASSCQRTLDGGFYLPDGIAVDGAGNLYVADSGNNRVVELPFGCTSSACEIPIGSGWNDPGAVAVDSAGDVFVEDFANHRVVKVPAGGGAQTTVVSDLQFSYGIAVDGGGDLFVSDFGHQRIFEVPAGGGAASTIASGLDRPYGITLDAAGNVFFSHFASHDVISEIRRAQTPFLTFATTAVGTVSSDSPQVITIGNSGNTPLPFIRLLLEPDPNFTRETGPGTPADCSLSFSLAPGASCDLSISFTPTEDGPLNGSVVLNDNTLNAPTIATQIISLVGTGTSSGASINFVNGFASAATGLALNGGATIQGTALQLTDGGTNERRSAFYDTPIGLSSFQTEFDFQLGGEDTLGTDADGFTFVLQSNGPNALGSSGGGLGYGLPAIGQSGPSITNSVAIKFDLHNNDGEGSSSTGLYVNGAAPTTPSINLLPGNIDLHSGHTFHVKLLYDGSTLTLTITDKSTHAVLSHPFTVDIAGILGGPTGFAGFTGSTGGKTVVVSILDWQLISSECCKPGEPAFLTGFTPSEISLNGQAEITGGTLLLATDAGLEASSAFFSTPVPINKFSSDFNFVLSREAGEGFTFVVQTAGLHAVGSPGGGLGYGLDLPGAGGAKIEHSVAVKFDLHSDAGEGSNSTGVYVGGESPTVPSTNLAPSGINLHGGHVFHARLTYDGVNLRVSITDLTQYAVFTGTYAVAIPTAVGGAAAYAGFTAGTGDLYDTIKILNWSMTSY
jgi:sugar lactone lactonase YvrE